MPFKWFCKLGDRQYGPLSAEQLQKMVQRGQITSSSLLRREDKEDWMPTSRIKGLLPGNAAPASASIPKASPAAAKPVTAKSAPLKATPGVSSTAPGQPASMTAATPDYPTVIKAVPPVEPESKPTPDVRRRQSNSTVLIVGGAVACGIVVMCGVVYLALNISDDGESSNRAIAANATNSVAASPPATAPADVSKTKSNTAREPSNSASAAHLDSIKKWYDASKAGVRMGDVRVKVLAIWRADELDTNAAAAAAPDADNEDRGVEAHSKTTESNNGKYLFVRVNIDNRAADDLLNYTSWNGDSPDESFGIALLVDDKGTAYELVSRSELTSNERLRKVGVEPNTSATDLLVFNAPQGEFTKLRLVLPYAAIEKPGAIGFEIAADAIRTRSQITNPTIVASPTAVADSTPNANPDLSAVAKDDTGTPAPLVEGIAGSKENDKSANAGAAVTAKEKPEEKPAKTGPPTAEELNRQFEDFNKDKPDAPKKDKPADK